MSKKMVAENESQLAQKTDLLSKSDANAAIRGIDNLYWAIYQLGYYLPSRGSQCISSQYLIGVMNKQIYCPQRVQVTAGRQTYKKCKKVEIYNQLCKSKNDTLGFDITRLPDKQWLIDVLYLLNSEHELFQFCENQEKEEQHVMLPLQLFNDNGVNMNVFPNKKGILFRKTKIEKDAEKAAALKKRIQKKEDRILLLAATIKKIEEHKKTLEASK
ncbi:hypothetical protein ABPG72_020068 [Tetrahymena utriculariae]